METQPAAKSPARPVPAFGGDGTLYVATTTGDLVSLAPKTLKVKDVYRAGQELTSTPVTFLHNDKTMIAATAKDGRIHLLDAAAMAGAATKSAPYSTATDFIPGALSTWQDAAGTRWIFAPTAGPVSPDASFSTANGAVTNGAVVAWKVVGQGSALALEPGWVSRDLVSPMTPLVINGVVFAVSSGEARNKDGKMTAAQRASFGPGGALRLGWLVRQGTVEQREDDHLVCARQRPLGRHRPKYLGSHDGT